jgi:hypothetical protein
VLAKSVAGIIAQAPAQSYEERLRGTSCVRKTDALPLRGSDAERKRHWSGGHPCPHKALPTRRSAARPHSLHLLLRFAPPARQIWCTKWLLATGATVTLNTRVTFVQRTNLAGGGSAGGVKLTTVSPAAPMCLQPFCLPLRMS